MSDKGSTRPYCFWDPFAEPNPKARLKRPGRAVPHRYYTYSGRAHDSCMWYVKHLREGDLIELLNRDNGNLLAVYVRGERDVTWYSGKDATDVVRKATQEIQRNNGKKAARKGQGKLGAAGGNQETSRREEHHGRAIQPKLTVVAK